MINDYGENAAHFVYILTINGIFVIPGLTRDPLCISSTIGGLRIKSGLPYMANYFAREYNKAGRLGYEGGE